MNRGNISKQLYLLLRSFLAILGVGLIIWLIKELCAGQIHWSVGDYISGETIEAYMAESTIAKIVASLLFSLLAFGLIAYAAKPKILLSYPAVLLIWIFVLIILGLMLKPFSTRIGP